MRKVGTLAEKAKEDGFILSKKDSLAALDPCPVGLPGFLETDRAMCREGGPMPTLGKTGCRVAQN